MTASSGGQEGLLTELPAEVGEALTPHLEATMYRATPPRAHSTRPQQQDSAWHQGKKGSSAPSRFKDAHAKYSFYRQSAAFLQCKYFKFHKRKEKSHLGLTETSIPRLSSFSSKVWFAWKMLFSVSSVQQFRIRQN